MDVIERFSEQSYACKQDVLDEFGYQIGNVMWDEIEHYRHQFLFRLPHSQQYIVLCRNVVFTLLQTERKLFQIKDKTLVQKDIAYSQSWNTLIQRLKTNAYQDEIQWCQEACTVLHIQQVDIVKELFLMDCSITLLFLLCIQIFYEQGDDVIRMYLMKENLLYMYSYIPSFQELDIKLGKQKDLTYLFLEFLEKIQLKIYEGMVLLNSSKNLNQQSLTIEELKECYPQLCDGQIRFYLTHCEKDHYYDIQQYLQFVGVCYETARCSMDELVDLCWYKKRKLGKRFVYYI